MKPETWVRVSALFEEALRLPPAEHASFLERACAGEPELRAEVERLLHLDQGPGESFEAPAVLLAAVSTPSPGARIGRFTLKRVLASGGMGTVFEAEQDQPRRTVALKTLRLGLGSSSRRARFQLEAEVLGSLRHPAIAQIHEAGTHESAGEVFPYFAMELVVGARDLLSHARAEGLALEQRVELFLPICDAVQHGHQRGVIHRDLKPSNLLVDAEGRPKVIDFGVARVTRPDAPVETSTTQPGQLVGTLQYMSPEQLAGDPVLVDARADVYSLGVVLYELLVGRAPYELAGLSLEEAARRVREATPPRPRSLPKDLGWILLRALEKDPERRYPSVSELAADLRRFLAHEAVLAGAPGAGYRLAKLARRHRILLGTTAAVVGALAVGLVRAQRSARAEGRAREEAQLQALKASTVNDFLASTLNSVSPAKDGRQVLVLDVLGEASRSIDARVADPEVRAALHKAIGDSYDALEQFGEAEVHLAQARAFVLARGGPDDAFELGVLASWARHLLLTERLPDAESLSRELLARAERGLGPASDTALALRGTLGSALCELGRAEEGERILLGNLELLRQRYGDRDERLIQPLYDLGRAALRKGHDPSRLVPARERVEQALELCRELLPPDHFRTQLVRLLLARILLTQGATGPSMEISRQVLGWSRANLGDRQRLTLAAINTLGTALRYAEEYDEARALFEEACDLADQLNGPTSLLALAARLDLSQLYEKLGLGERALEVAQAGLDGAREGLLPPSHPVCLMLRQALASALSTAHRPAEAEEVLRALVPDTEAAFGPNDAFVLEVLGKLGYVLAVEGKQAELEALVADLERRAPEAPSTGLVESFLHLSVEDLPAAQR